MNSNLVSVVIPAYNRADTIERAVRSVLNQTYQELEVIVVDDCSTDNTAGIINLIDDSRLKYHRLEKNSGACIARNTGVCLSKGNLIAFQDSDDYWYPSKLEKQIQYLIENEYEFISCPFNRISGTISAVIGVSDCPDNKVDLWCKLLNSNWVSTQTILCYKYCFDKIGFDPQVKRYQDWDLALQAACYFKIGSLNEALVDVYLQEDSITNTVKSEQAKIYIVNKHQKDVDLKNKKMVAQYYKVLGDATRKNTPFKAAKSYWKSFWLEPNFKKILCCILCSIGLMRFYNSRL